MCVWAAIIQFAEQNNKKKKKWKIEKVSLKFNCISKIVTSTQTNEGGPQNRQQINWKRAPLFTRPSNSTISCQIECKNLIKLTLPFFPYYFIAHKQSDHISIYIWAACMNIICNMFALLLYAQFVL